MAVDTPLRLTWLCLPEALLLLFVTAVDLQIIRASDIQLDHKYSALLMAVDTPPRSTQLCRSEVLPLEV